MTDGNTYAINKHLDEREDYDALQEIYAELEQAEARIDELETKLSKCVGALGDISNGEPEWPDDPQRELDWCRNRATTTLEEMKGQDDE